MPAVSFTPGVMTTMWAGREVGRCRETTPTTKSELAAAMATAAAGGNTYTLNMS